MEKISFCGKMRRVWSAVYLLGCQLLRMLNSHILYPTHHKSVVVPEKFNPRLLRWHLSADDSQSDSLAPSWEKLTEKP